MDRSFGKKDPPLILRVTSNYRSTIATATGTIPVDPSDDAGDGGGTSGGVSPEARATHPNSHTPAGFRQATVHHTRHPRFQENHRHRRGYVDNSLPRVLAHTHHAATSTAFSIRISMVDPYAKLRTPLPPVSRRKPNIRPGPTFGVWSVHAPVPAWSFRRAALSRGSTCSGRCLSNQPSLQQLIPTQSLSQ